MDPNQNLPYEREWSEEEKNDFCLSVANILEQNADKDTGILTGIPNGSVSLNSFVHEKLFAGIHVTSITPPEKGWTVAYHCPLCKNTVFLLSPWAVKPDKDDYWRMNDMCADEVLGFKHNMQLGMKGYSAPIELKPGNIDFMLHDPLPQLNEPITLDSLIKMNDAFQAAYPVPTEFKDGADMSQATFDELGKSIKMVKPQGEAWLGMNVDNFIGINIHIVNSIPFGAVEPCRCKERERETN